MTMTSISMVLAFAAALSVGLWKSALSNGWTVYHIGIGQNLVRAPAYMPVRSR